MKFLVDAQLPVRLVRLLSSHGHDAIHTVNLAAGNRSSDSELAKLADKDNRVIITKDCDFRDSHFLNGTPCKLLVVATGNIKNNQLLQLFEAHLTRIVSELEAADYIELNPHELITYPKQTE